MIKSRAAAVFAAATSGRQAVIDRYRSAVDAPGDPKAGAAVFRRVCASCHRFEGP